MPSLAPCSQTNFPPPAIPPLPRVDPKPLPACPKYFAPRCFPVRPRTSPSPFLSNSLTSAVAAAQKKAASLLCFSPSAKDGVARPVFLGEEKTDCVSPSFLCSDRPRFALVSFFNFLHSPLNYNCSSSKNCGEKKKQNNSEKFSRKSVMRFKKRNKKKQRCMRKKNDGKLTSSDHFKLDDNLKVFQSRPVFILHKWSFSADEKCSFEGAIRV